MKNIKLTYIFKDPSSFHVEKSFIVFQARDDSSDQDGIIG